MDIKNFCSDLDLAVVEFQKEITEHRITDTKTLEAFEATKAAWRNLCWRPPIEVSCEHLQRASEIWRKEIKRFSWIINLTGWITGKNQKYYHRIQNGIDSALRDLKCPP